MPARGQTARGTASGGGGAGVQWEWEGDPVKARFAAVALAGMQRLLRRAESYWRSEEWTKGNHPYMGRHEPTEEELGYFVLEPQSNGAIRFVFGTTASYAFFEEFGHGSFPGHHPVRNVLDRYGYRLTDAIREEARAQGLVA